MKEQKKDLLCLCINAFGNTFYHLWPILFSYYASYCYALNKDTKMTQIYAGQFSFLIGQLLGTFILPVFFFILGTNLMFICVIIIELFSSIYCIYNVQYWDVWFVTFLKGIIFQGINTAVNLTLTEKYQSGILKVKYVASSRLIFSFVFTFLCQYIINPNDISSTTKSISGDYFFPEYVALKFSSFIITYTIISSLALLVPVIFVKSPLNYQCKLKQFILYIFNQGQFDWSEQNKQTNLESLNESSFIIDSQKQKSNKSLNLLDKDKQDDKIINQKMKVKNINFIMNILGLIAMFNISINYYTLDIYKYLGLVFNISDFLLSFYFVISSAVFILGTFLSSYIWQNFGFDASMNTLHLINMLNLIAIIFSKSFFQFEIIFARLGLSQILMFQDLFCFSTFNSYDAMKYMKYFILYNALGVLLQTLLNYWIFNEVFYTRVFNLLFLGSLISYILYFIYLKGGITKNNQLYFQKQASSMYQIQFKLIRQNFKIKF